tara:strand:- start:901 stop:1656 length:756 start_codon:yes stop_codon:yes gene_type:complete
MTTEDWARNIVANELGMQVDVHDNGSQSGMYDLIIGSVSNPKYAIECVGSVDPAATETWNIGPAKGHIKVDSSGDWRISIRKSTNIKSLRRHIANVIGECEKLGLIEFLPVDWQIKRFSPELFNKLDILGITSIYMFRSEGHGDVHLIMDGSRGPVSHNGDDLAEWIGDFLNSQDKADVVIKLAKSGAKEKHAFIPIVLGGAPWGVESYFFGDMNLPCIEPKLPEPITGVWVVLDGKGLRYMEGQWHAFRY